MIAIVTLSASIVTIAIVTVTVSASIVTITVVTNLIFLCFLWEHVSVEHYINITLIQYIYWPRKKLLCDMFTQFKHSLL